MMLARERAIFYRHAYLRCEICAPRGVYYDKRRRLTDIYARYAARAMRHVVAAC